jgi:hypothetical protein
LEHDDVARPDTTGLQRRRECTGGPLDVGHRAAIRPDRGMEGHHRVGLGRQTLGHHLAQ